LSRRSVYQYTLDPTGWRFISTELDPVTQQRWSTAHRPTRVYPTEAQRQRTRRPQPTGRGLPQFRLRGEEHDGLQRAFEEETDEPPRHAQMRGDVRPASEPTADL